MQWWFQLRFCVTTLPRHSCASSLCRLRICYLHCSTLHVVVSIGRLWLTYSPGKVFALCLRYGLRAIRIEIQHSKSRTLSKCNQYSGSLSSFHWDYIFVVFVNCKICYLFFLVGSNGKLSTKFIMTWLSQTCNGIPVVKSLALKLEHKCARCWVYA